MISAARMPSTRWLAAIMVAVGAIVFTYGVVAFATCDDPLRGLVVAMVVAPAVVPIVFGVLMFRGRRWAATVLRAYLLVLLGIGAWMHVVVGLGVFAPASFGVPLVGACVAWGVLSVVAEGRPVRAATVRRRST